LGGAGFKPCRLITLTTLCKSSSGCSSVRAMSSSFINRTRAQSVLEVFEEEVRFPLGGVAERDDSDFIFSLRVNNGNSKAAKKSEAEEALLPIRHAAVFNGASGSSKNFWDIGKVEAMLPEIGGPFRLVPGKAHGQSVYTEPSRSKSPCRSADRPPPNETEIPNWPGPGYPGRTPSPARPGGAPESRQVASWSGRGNGSTTPFDGHLDRQGGLP